MKYKKKPVVVEAFQFTDDEIETLIGLQEFMRRDIRLSYKNPENPILKIETLEGTIDASIGDYIIKGISGEFYPCKPDIFKATYERVEE